ncbi:MAG: flagellar basal body P-ring formation chaperone FlgA [Planctomycetaceae bacterium]
MNQRQIIIAICSLLGGVLCCAGSPVLAKDRLVAGSSRGTIELIIRLREKTSSANSLVRLGDCAEIVTDDETLQRQLEELTLFPAPPGGRKVSVDYDWIRARLNAHGINLARVEFTGSPLVTVVGPELDEQPVRKIAAAKPVIQVVEHRVVEKSLTHRDRDRARKYVAELIRRKLIEHDAGWNAAEIVTTLNDDDVELVNSAVSGTWDVHSASEAESTEAGYVQLWTLSFADRAGTKQMVAVTAEILPPPQILTLKHNVPSGYVLQANDLEWSPSSRRDVDVVRWEEVVGKETVRPLRALAPLTKKDVRRQILVRHNDIVSVTVNIRGIRVSKEFKANAQGGLGETVPLTSLDGRQKITARVTGLHEAEVVTEPRTALPVADLSEEQPTVPRPPQETADDAADSSPTTGGIRISIGDARAEETDGPKQLNNDGSAQPLQPPRRWKQTSAMPAVAPVARRQSPVNDAHHVRP